MYDTGFFNALYRALIPPCFVYGRSRTCVSTAPILEVTRMYITLLTRASPHGLIETNTDIRQRDRLHFSTRFGGGPLNTPFPILMEAWTRRIHCIGYGMDNGPPEK